MKTFLNRPYSGTRAYKHRRIADKYDGMSVAACGAVVDQQGSACQACFPVASPLATMVVVATVVTAGTCQSPEPACSMVMSDHEAVAATGRVARSADTST